MKDQLRIAAMVSRLYDTDSMADFGGFNSQPYPSKRTESTSSGPTRKNKAQRNARKRTRKK